MRELAGTVIRLLFRNKTVNEFNKFPVFDGELKISYLRYKWTDAD